MKDGKHPNDSSVLAPPSGTSPLRTSERNHARTATVATSLPPTLNLVAYTAVRAVRHKGHWNPEPAKKTQPPADPNAV